MSFQNTKLWKHAFDRRESDPYADNRELLRTNLLTMRSNVEKLISYIPADCKDLTVHDISHLDALWEAAQQVCGECWALNPAEAFVFGAAALIHDAGLTTLAYRGGRDQLTKTSAWADIAARNGGANFDPSAALFEVLRGLHAEQASRLCMQSWETPDAGSVFLIENSELRVAYGECIGRIAHSHHWDVAKLQDDLAAQFPASVCLPPEWVVNELKLGCLIRCADAAQIDRTRAPIMLHAALGPKGYSGLHWGAQSKLNRPLLQGDAIYLMSSASYTIGEADAWWVAHDLASTLDRELRASNAILTNINETTFAAQRVAGVESPLALAKYIKPVGWKPIDASVRVTDPLKIARTLGGRNLYGQSNVVPIRELLQNSADAIRARRALRGGGQEFGLVNISIDHHPEDQTKCLLNIDDNGIGMSERVLSTTLVDFGRSFWNSGIMEDEFPGLRSKQVSHIGKFGIGFFSVFELSEKVKVVSRRYDYAERDARVLEFKGLITRPLLREAVPGELPMDMSTRITLEVSKEALKDGDEDDDEGTDYFRDRYLTSRGRSVSVGSFRETILGMCSFLDVRVAYSDNINGEKFDHSADIYGKTAEIFISELPLIQQRKLGFLFDPASALSPLKDVNGDGLGRAAFDLDALIDFRVGDRGFHSVGGIVAPSRMQSLASSRGIRIPFLGVVEAKTERAARDLSAPICPPEAVDNWLLDQIKQVDTSLLRKSEVMKLASFALGATGKDCGHPFCYFGGELKTSSEMISIAKAQNEFSFPVSWRYDAYPEILGYNALTSDFFEASLSSDIAVLGANSERLLEEDDARDMNRSSGGKLYRDVLVKKWEAGKVFIDLIERAWGGTCSVRMQTKQIFSTRIASLAKNRWVVTIEKT